MTPQTFVERLLSALVPYQREPLALCAPTFSNVSSDVLRTAKSSVLVFAASLPADVTKSAPLSAAWPMASFDRTHNYVC